MRTLLFLFLLTTLPAPAGDLDLYVKNRPFDGPTRQVGHEIFVPLDDLLRSLGCGWRVDHGRLMVSSRSSGEGPLLESVNSLVFDGRPVRVNQHRYTDRIYVSVAELAQAIGARFQLNPELGSADLYAPLAMAPPREDVVVTDGSGENSPLAVDKLSFDLAPSADEPTDREMRGYAIVQNRSPQWPVKSVVVRVTVVDGAGNVLGRFAEEYPSLAPGESVTYQFPVFVDFEGAEGVRPVIELEHAPLR